MREIEKEEDSPREERRVGGCQPRRRSIFDGKQFPLLKLLQDDTAILYVCLCIHTCTIRVSCIQHCIAEIHNQLLNKSCVANVSAHTDTQVLDLGSGICKSEHNYTMSVQQAIWKDHELSGQDMDVRKDEPVSHESLQRSKSSCA